MKESQERGRTFPSSGCAEHETSRVARQPIGLGPSRTPDRISSTKSRELW